MPLRIQTFAMVDAHRTKYLLGLSLLCALVIGSSLVAAPAEAAKNKPSVSSLSTSAGPSAGGKKVTITGKNFTRASKVRFGTTYSAKVKKLSSTRLTAVTPPHAAGKIYVRVKTSRGTSAISKRGAFTYRKAPIISSVSSATGPLKGGTTITITGRYFTSTSKVRFGTTYSAKVRKSSSTKLTAVTPSHAAGKVDVRVKTSGGTSKTTNAATFTYFAAPTISALSSSKGSPQGGDTITIRGTSFVSGAKVLFGSTNATGVKVTSPNEVTAVAPSHPTERVHVTVSTPYGTSKSHDRTGYQYGPASQLGLTVGSFNVRTASGYISNPGPYEKSWTKRVPVVASQIKRSGMDVLGVQEASASTTHTATGVPQFQDLVNRLGAPYALTNATRYCEVADKAGRCQTGASSSDRIIYNTERLTLLAQGSRKLDNRSATDGSGRYVLWASFTDKHTDKKFFFVSTHLEPNKVGKMNGATRATQVKTILSEIRAKNTANLPTIFVGDLAATKFDKETPANIAHTMLTDAGFVDPLINTYKYKGADALPATLVHTRYNSLNYFQKTPGTVDKSYAIGSYVDYILVRAGNVTMSKWQTVLDLDSNDEFAGVIPSDHNLIGLTLELP